jgi:hypothetical protein
MSAAPVPSIGSLSPADLRQVEALCSRFEAACKAGPRPRPNRSCASGGRS